MSPSSRGLGHHPFTVGTGVRIPLEMPSFLSIFSLFCSGWRNCVFFMANLRVLLMAQGDSPWKIHYNYKFCRLIVNIMRRLSRTGSSRLCPDSQRLVSLALEMFHASSLLESEFCRKKMETLVSRLLHAKKQSVLNDAIEYLFSSEMPIPVSRTQTFTSFSFVS